MAVKASKKLLAIIFTDIVGYTRLMGKNELEALEILEQSRHLHHDFAKEFQGTVIKEMGDGQLLQFDSALNALNFALKLQMSVKSSPLENKLRVGIHIGDVTHDNADVFGDGVNIASRIQSISDPGGIYISEDIQHLVRSYPEYDLKDLGPVNLKNVDQPIRIFAVQGHGLPQAKNLRSYKSISIIALSLLILTSIILFLDQQLHFFQDDQIESVSVIPFTSVVNGEIVQDHWSFNMTNSLMSRLGKISSIKSVYTSLNQPVTAQAGIIEIGGDLGVDAILTGTISREGPMVTVNTMLIDIRNEEIVWSEIYTREVRNILKLQSELVQAIIDAIEVAITPDELKAIASNSVVDARGFEYLLKAQYHLYRLNPDNYDSALYYFNLASVYPGLESKAYGGISLVWAHKGQWGGEDPLVSAAKLIKAYKKAFEFNPTEEDAMLARAHAYTSYFWDWDSAQYSFEEALRYNPNHVEPHLFYADLLVSLHLNERAFGHVDNAVALDPNNPFVHCIKGWVLFANEMYEEAEIALHKSLLSAGYPISLSHRCLWAIYDSQNNYEKAAYQAGEFYASQGIQQIKKIFQNVSTQSGYRKALQEAAIALEEYKQTAYVSSMRVARLYAFLGDKNSALDWLEKAYDEHYTSFFSLNVDPHWESLRQEIRFKTLVAEMNLTLPRK